MANVAAVWREISKVFNKLELGVLENNASTHFSTQMSPFKALFGHEMTTPLDLQFGIAHESEEWRQLRERRLDNSQVAQNRQVRLYNRRLREEHLEVGDLVLWHHLDQKAGSSKKLNKRWQGPFRVQAIDSPNVEITDGKGRARWIHGNHLKLFQGAPQELDLLRGRGRPARTAEPGGEEQRPHNDKESDKGELDSGD